MLAIDSSAWIEWLIGGPLTEELAQRIPVRSKLLVPTIVQHEVTKWLLREKGEEAADEFVAFTEKCVVAVLDTATAIDAAHLSRQHKLATADAVIYATALRHGAGLLTCDAHFDGLPGVTFLAKIDT
ncbi:putative nucleic acid-binding protein [Hoeflea marina]|uniref:Ribonuclease VapC n=1 Tax=Hoeflea marina TaxID=274592 RepID=A0A317PL14_9HYPH|nr:type II toxin-antitoxin system VapC family toxin [Hoeflea marina]PWW01655.1 putative nucleic acid-binding protein [Hoeflea marina]